MFADTFMRAEVTGLSVEKVAALYAAWALGSESPVRERRLAEGVLPTWTTEHVLASETLVGDHGCRVEMRLSPDRMLLRFVHRDEQDGALFWHTVARVVRTGQQLLVEHAVGRDAPRDYRLWPIASPSRVLVDLLDHDGTDIRPKDLSLPLITLDEGQVDGFVEHVLLRPDRQLPLVVVACDRDDKPALVAPERLARRLRGICAVATLRTQAATYEFSDAVAGDRLGAEFRCFNGAVHSYGPTRTLREDHRLWLGDGLRQIEPRRRTDVVAGMLSRRIAIRDTPNGFFNLIEEHDREERRALARRLSEKRSTPPPAPSSVPSAYVDQVESEKAALQAELRKALEAEKDATDAWNKADDERRLAERSLEDAEAALEQEKALSSDLREQLGTIALETTHRRKEEDIEAVRDTLAARFTPVTCLTLVRFAYSERLAILDTAFTSAKKSADFRHGEKLLGLLRTLATGYWEALVAGKGDQEASKAFTPKTFAATESEGTQNNARAIRERTFTYKGRSIVMWPHLKIGNAETTTETIRVHFEWIAEERKIVIGWCGEHRYRIG